MNGQRGFSLLEVLVAIVVLSIGALAVARGMGTALATGIDAGEQTRASALAVDRLEYLKSRPASEVDDEPAERIDARGLPDPDGPYVRSVAVTDASEGARPNTKEVTVRVEYQAGQRGPREVEVYTVLFVNDT
jgi:type IV pilus assembly protein PilV